MAKQDSTLRTFIVIGVLCLVCSLLVCVSVVALKDLQSKAMNVDREKSILAAAQIEFTDSNVSQVYADNIEARLLDLNSGDFVLDQNEISKIVGTGTVDGYNFVSASKLAESNISIPADKDLAKIRVRAKYMPVYLVKSAGGYSSIILPFYGQGLWSTMYGYLSVATDGNTIRGVKYYSHGETPGLGAEIENPAFTATWVNKKLFNEAGDVAFKVTKKVEKPEYEIDALSGATLTSNGVSTSVEYWASSNGYGPFLQKVKKEGVK
jgi:Na+-transporting NADH:ubiquinone oxidoreductase subunit C